MRTVRIKLSDFNYEILELFAERFGVSLTRCASDIVAGVFDRIKLEAAGHEGGKEWKKSNRAL